jgi:hypothetical protein
MPFMRRHASRPSRTALLALLIPLALSLPGAAPAQTLAEQTAKRPARKPVAAGPSHILSINPFMPILGLFQGEYEKRLQDNLSVALSGSYTRLEDDYTNIDVKLRLYPNEMALDGIGLAAGVGYGSVRRRDNFERCDMVGADCAPSRTTESAPTFSVEGLYQWMLGTRRSTAVTMGGGVKRYFISSERDAGISRVVPTLRLTIGYAWR